MTWKAGYKTASHYEHCKQIRQTIVQQAELRAEKRLSQTAKY